ncbi:CFEM domain-containing protein [Rhizoctonia solani AG-1 IA]|uniref:CFEM domain-containing protein n=1 Tax=Thanatephorus cucumeris (strain AG1-IA) TaxID=983506 RepID=L8WZ91_THACA|nr:CFEM domain-containing protein [Rhizoctonia solani AG-1 IA]
MWAYQVLHVNSVEFEDSASVPSSSPDQRLYKRARLDEGAALLVAFSLLSIIMKSVFAFAALFAAYAAAQTTTSSATPPVSTGDISPCVMQCSTQAAQTAGCTGITDVECLCGSTEFQKAALTCLQSQCPDEVASATALQSQLCGAAGESSGSSTAPTASETETEVSGTVSSSGTASVPATGTATTPAGTTTHTTTRPTTSATSPRPTSSSATGTPTGAANSASAPFDFAATGAWAAVALGGAVVAQLAL